jgi:hypothetical protein
MLYSKKQFDAGGKLKLKAIADCVESIIGAFFEEYGEQVDARARRVRSSLPLSLSLSLSLTVAICVPGSSLSPPPDLNRFPVESGYHARVWQATTVLLQKMKIIPVTEFPLQSFMDASSESAEGVPLRECASAEDPTAPIPNVSLERLERRLRYTMQVRGFPSHPQRVAGAPGAAAPLHDAGERFPLPSPTCRWSAWSGGSATRCR